MKYAIFAAIFVMMVTGSLGGRITAWGDPDVMNPNSGRISYIDLYLTLDTQLPTGHVMRVSFPFSIAPTFTSIVAYTATGKGAFLSSTLPTTTIAGARQLTNGTSSANNYFTFASTLAAATNYVIRFTFSTNHTDSGFLGYIQVETMSPANSVLTSGSDTAITYDLNNAFAPLEIFAAPGTPTLAMTADTNATVASASSLRSFKITPSSNIFYWPAILISWGNSAFTVTTAPVSVDGGLSTTVTAMNISSTPTLVAGSFYYTSTTTSVTIFHNAVMSTTLPVTYNLTINNPSTTNTASYTVQIFHRFNYNLTDYLSTAQTIQVTGTSTSTSIIFQNLNVLLSWGVNMKTTPISGNTYLSKIFAVYGTLATNPLYQALTFTADFNSTLTSGAYTLDLSICSGSANCDILENSIVTNVSTATCYSISNSSLVVIHCTTTGAPQTTGNSIGARIWLLGASAAATNMIGYSSPSYSIADSKFGVWTLSQPANTSFTNITSSATSATNVQYNSVPLANLNGNGPMAAIPVSLNSTIWTSANTGTTSLLSTGPPTSTSFGAGSISAATLGGGNAFGGIYGSTTASSKYNVALFTTAIIANAAGTDSFGGMTNPDPQPMLPGIDIFMNPNVFSSASTSNPNPITTCWAGITRTYTSAVTGAFGSQATMSAGSRRQLAGAGLDAANCFSNLPSTSTYFRLRYAITTSNTAANANTKIGLATATGANVADGNLLLTKLATPNFLSFMWENAFTITNAYAGASLRADSNVGDFYGGLWAALYSTNPLPTATTSVTDQGELGSLLNISTAAVTAPVTANFALGTPFFWTQMIMAPYGAYTPGAAALTPYFTYKSVFLSNWDGLALDGTQTTSYIKSTRLIWLLRIRGAINSTSDTGAYPSSGGKMELFLGIPNGLTDTFEGLGAAGVTTLAGQNKYNSASPLLGIGVSMRCWNSQSSQSCTIDRKGRPQPAAVGPAPTSAAVGLINTIDNYEIISTDATYTSNFSIVMVLRPFQAFLSANLAKYSYRLGFVANNLHYIQPWDQTLDNSATVNTGTGQYTPSATPFPAGSAITASPATDTACTLASTWVVDSTTSARIVPASTDTVNSVISSGTFSINTKAGYTSLSKYQGSIVWCSLYNFRASASFALGSASALEGASATPFAMDKCYSFDYLPSENSATTNFYYCIYCPNSGSSGLPGSTASSAVNLTLTNLTSGPQTSLLTTSLDMVANDVGMAVEAGTCTSLAASTGYYWQPGSITSASSNGGSAFNLQGQKVIISFTAPSTIASGVVDTINFIGKTSVSTPGSDTTFPYGTADSNLFCRLVPGGGTTSTAYATFISCGTVTISGGTIGITGFTIPAANASVTSWSVYIWGFNGNVTSATTPTTAYFQVQTLKGTTLVDQSSVTAASSLFTWPYTVAPSTTFTTASTYQRPIVGARGWLKIDVTFSQRTWFYTDKVVLNLDAVASASVNAASSTLKCRITDTSDTILQLFQSCTFSLGATPTVTIYLHSSTTLLGAFDYSASSGVRVYIENMVTMATTTNKTVYGTIYFAAGTTSLTKLGNATTDVTASSLATANAFTTGYPTVTKWWTAPSEFQDLVFGLYTNQAFNTSCRITIVFPSYYNPGLTTRSALPYCTVNGVYTQCAVGVVSTTGSVTLATGQRQLVIWGISTSISANSAVTVRVSGISSPLASYTSENFWIQINGDNTETTSTIIYAGALADPSYVTPATLYPLNVVWFGVGSTATRSTTTFTWSLYLNNATATVNTSSAIQAIFPENWGLAWGEFAPSCQVVDFTNSSTTYSAAVSATTGNNAIFGNLVNMNISTAIPAGAVVNVTCSNVRTGNNDGTYRSQDVQIRVVDANGTSVYLRAAPGQHNQNFSAAYAKGSSQTYVSWATTTSSTSPGALTAGTYSLAVSATVPSKSSRSFTITPSNSQFSFLSSTAPFWIVTGTTSNSTQLGCAGSVPIGLYVLTFTISDTSAVYVAPPPMWVSVNSNAQTITPSSTTLSAYYSSSSLSSTAPLYFDLTTMPPYADLTITPVAPTGNTNFTFSPSSIKLTPGAPKNYFVFTSTAAATVAASAAYTFTLSGTNVASYTLTSTVTVSLTTDSGTGSVNTPSITVSADSTDTSAATSKIITFTLTQVTQATVYWVVTLQGQQISDATAIQTNAAALTAYNVNSANQAQYFTNYVVTSTKTSVTVSNLFPNTGYTVSAVAVSNTNKSSTVATYTFVTGINAAVIQRWLFNYTTYPSQTQRQTLLCQITQILAVPAVNVRDVNGEICGNTTTFYSSSNSTGDLGVYFYPLQAATDATMTAAALQTNLNTTAIIGTLNTTLSAGTSGLGFVNTWIDIATIKNAAPGITLPTSIPSTQLTSASVYVTASFSNDTGFLFVALCSNTSTTPTAIQLKQAAANISTITGLQNIQVFYFYPGATLTYNFTSLSPSTSYNVYLVASNNDPSFLQNFTSVTAISVTTPAISTTTGSPIGVIFSVMAIFASVISLMFF